MAEFLYLLKALAWAILAGMGAGMTWAAWSKPCWEIEPEFQGWRAVVFQNCSMFAFTMAFGMGSIQTIKNLIDLVVYINAN